MNENQKNHFRQILNAQKRSLSSDIQNTMSSMQDTQTIYADPNDRASQETDMAIELRNRDRERKLIKKIDETLAAINRDDYGYCEECGEEIGISRLEARPTARLCIECKHLAELRERQMGK
ncbi:MAG: RNA polymerase-binding protein DksA [Rhodocyclaceae bacterium]